MILTLFLSTTIRNTHESSNQGDITGSGQRRIRLRPGQPTAIVKVGWAFPQKKYTSHPAGSLNPMMSGVIRSVPNQAYRQNVAMARNTIAIALTLTVRSDGALMCIGIPQAVFFGMKLKVAIMTFSPIFFRHRLHNSFFSTAHSLFRSECTNYAGVFCSSLELPENQRLVFGERCFPAPH